PPRDRGCGRTEEIAGGPGGGCGPCCRGLTPAELPARLLDGRAERRVPTRGHQPHRHAGAAHAGLAYVPDSYRIAAGGRWIACGSWERAKSGEPGSSTSSSI